MDIGLPSDDRLSRDLAQSWRDWWNVAGAEDAVCEEARDWLAAPAERSALGKASVAGPALDRPMPFPSTPDTLAAFLNWLATSPEQPEAAYAKARVLPEIVEGAPILIVTDMPRPEDVAEGRLLTGEADVLVGAMLRALGRDRVATSVASLLLAWPPGGVIDDAGRDQVAVRLQRLARLARPQWIVTMGDATGRALETMDWPPEDGKSGKVKEHDGKMRKIALPSLTSLARQPARKRAAWATLRDLASNATERE